MSVPRPPPYNPPSQAQDPDDRDHEKPNETSLWSYIQAFIIFAVLAIVITELVLSVQNRGLAHHAIGLATTANETAENANVPAAQFGSVVTELQKGMATVTQEVEAFQTGFANVTAKVGGLEKAVAEVTAKVNKLQSLVQALPTKAYSRSSSTSAAPAASSSYYYSGAERLRVQSGPDAAVWLVWIGRLVVMFL